MIHPQTSMPPRDPKDEPSNGLLDPDFPADSDSEFLTDLDRVLSIDGSEFEQQPLSADITETLECFDLDIESVGGEHGESGEPTPIRHETAHLGPEEPPVPEVRSRLQDQREHRRPAPAADEAATTAPKALEIQGGAKSQSSSTTASIPPGSANRRPSPVEESGTETAITRQREPDVGVTRRPKVSPVWLGIVALLATIAIGIGAGGIWLQRDADARLAQMEANLSAAAPPSGVEWDAREAENAERLRALEQRLEGEITGLHGAQDDLHSSLVQRLGSQNERLDQYLRTLQSGLVELHEKLEAVQNQLADTRKRLDTADSQQAKTSSAPAAASSEPARKEGNWAVNLMSFRRQATADKKLAQLRDDGIPATVRTIVHKGQTWYRLLVGGFADFAQAKAFAEKIRAKPGLSSAWIGRS